MPSGLPAEMVFRRMYLKHRRSCSHASLDRLTVLIISHQKEKSLVLALIKNGISVDVEEPGRKKTPDASLVIALNRGVIKEALQQLDALQNQRIEGRLAIFWSHAGSKVWGLKPARTMAKGLDTLKAKYKNFQLLHNLPARGLEAAGG